jgi:hypothetical protein
LGVIVRQGPAGSARLYTRADDAVAYRTVFDAGSADRSGLGETRDVCALSARSARGTTRTY